MPSKSSPLDVVPTSLLKGCSDTFSHIIAQLANLSFQRGQFPRQFKIAQTTLLLKRQGLEISDPSSYRPISNLNTISKIIERLVLKRITSHVHVTSVDRLQSAYRRFYSAETALLKITDDIYEGFNAGRSTLLVALDLSAAFDCIDHNTLLGRLQHTFGLSGVVLDWMRSYLNGRSSFVRLDSMPSTSVLECRRDRPLAQNCFLCTFHQWLT